MPHPWRVTRHTSTMLRLKRQIGKPLGCYCSCFFGLILFCVGIAKEGGRAALQYDPRCNETDAGSGSGAEDPELAEALLQLFADNDDECDPAVPCHVTAFVSLPSAAPTAPRTAFSRPPTAFSLPSHRPCHCPSTALVTARPPPFSCHRPSGAMRSSCAACGTTQ